MQDLNVLLLQCELAWENPPLNRQRIEQMLQAQAIHTDLVVLPETFSTGFSMAAEKIAEAEEGETQQWLQQLARRYDCAVVGSFAVRAASGIHNRLFFVTADTVAHYDKKHLFSLSGEDAMFTAGKERLIIPYRGWRICPMVCYDLRFPVWSRNSGDDYDLLLYIANWPAKRAYHWRQLLIARAIENQSCVIGVNRIGSDDNALDYCGDSLAIAADGHILLDCEDSGGVFSARFDAKALQTYRRKIPFLADGDSFKLVD